MHHRNAGVCALQLTQRRCASTATQVKAGTTTSFHDSVIPRPTLSKWAKAQTDSIIPQPTRNKWAKAQTTSFSRESDGFRGVSLRGGLAPSASKRARPATPRSQPGRSNRSIKAYIPTTVSVGQLARLLNVRQGMLLITSWRLPGLNNYSTTSTQDGRCGDGG